MVEGVRFKPSYSNVSRVQTPSVVFYFCIPRMALLAGSLEALAHVLPVDDVPDVLQCENFSVWVLFFYMENAHLDVVAANVLVLEVVRVLPHVDAQQRDEACILLYKKKRRKNISKIKTATKNNRQQTLSDTDREAGPGWGTSQSRCASPPCCSPAQRKRWLVGWLMGDQRRRRRLNKIK